MSASTAGQPHAGPHGALSHTSDGSGGLPAQLLDSRYDSLEPLGVGAFGEPPPLGACRRRRRLYRLCPAGNVGLGQLCNLLCGLCRQCGARAACGDGHSCGSEAAVERALLCRHRFE